MNHNYSFIEQDRDIELLDLSELEEIGSRVVNSLDDELDALEFAAEQVALEESN